MMNRYFFDGLPLYFHQYDSYKDGDGKGLLQRFMEIPQEEAETLYQDIKDIPKAMDPLQVQDSHLYMLGSVFGNPPTLFRNKANYRKLLRYLPNLLKRKGRIDALIDLFKIMGLEVTVEDVTPSKTFYDIGLEHDQGHRYDGQCYNCFFFILHVEDPSGVLPSEEGVLSENTLKELLFTAYYATPINAFISNITYNGESQAFLLEKAGLILKTNDQIYLKAKV